MLPVESLPGPHTLLIQRAN